MQGAALLSNTAQGTRESGQAWRSGALNPFSVTLLSNKCILSSPIPTYPLRKGEEKQSLLISLNGSQVTLSPF